MPPGTRRGSAWRRTDFGLRHFRERFAPGRRFEVPVEMGWRDRPLAESELNQVPVIA